MFHINDPKEIYFQVTKFQNNSLVSKYTKLLQFQIEFLFSPPKKITPMIFGGKWMETEVQVRDPGV